MKTLRINRSRWLRGESQSYLVRTKDEKKCCLGFYLESEGVKVDEMLGMYTPSSMYSNMPGQAIWLLDERKCGNSRDAKALMHLNDSKDFTEEIREHKIASIFLQHDIEVKFTD